MAKYKSHVRRFAYLSRLSIASVVGPADEVQLEQVRRQLAGKRLVFCLTNGRSGSNRLGDLFEAVRGLDAHHEPAPYFDLVRRRAALDPNLAKDFLLRIKLPYIAGLDAPIYVETSHLFNKAFFRPMLATGIPFDCVLLTRDMRSTALSMLSLDNRPGAPGMSTRFLIAPDEAECIPPPSFDKLTHYQQLCWHVLESDARSRAYAAELRAAGGRVAEVSLESLSEAATFRRLLEDLSIDTRAIDEGILHEKLTRRVNTKSGKRRDFSLTDAELDTEEKALFAMLKVAY